MPETARCEEHEADIRWLEKVLRVIEKEQERLATELAAAISLDWYRTAEPPIGSIAIRMGTTLTFPWRRDENGTWSIPSEIGRYRPDMVTWRELQNVSTYFRAAWIPRSRTI